MRKGCDYPSKPPDTNFFFLLEKKNGLAICFARIFILIDKLSNNPLKWQWSYLLESKVGWCASSCFDGSRFYTDLWSCEHKEGLLWGITKEDKILTKAISFVFCKTLFYVCICTNPIGNIISLWSGHAYSLEVNTVHLVSNSIKFFVLY